MLVSLVHCVLPYNAFSRPFFRCVRLLWCVFALGPIVSLCAFFPSVFGFVILSDYRIHMVKQKCVPDSVSIDQHCIDLYLQYLVRSCCTTHQFFCISCNRFSVLVRKGGKRRSGHENFVAYNICRLSLDSSVIAFPVL